MTDRISIVQNYLKQLITDADLEITGSKSLLDFAARVRRSTAEDVLAFIESLSDENATAQDGVPRGPAEFVPFRLSGIRQAAHTAIRLQ